MIDCEFSEVAQEASCVLVYREYDSPLLTVVDIPHLLHLPVSLTVDSPENYTFVLFGKHPVTGMEEHPVVTVKGVKKRDTICYSDNILFFIDRCKTRNRGWKKFPNISCCHIHW